MATIAEMLAAIKDTENPIEDADAFIAGIVKAHEDEISVRDAKVNQTLEAVKAKEAELTKLKVHNYDLIQCIPVADKPDENDKEPEAKASGVNAMFE